MSHRIVSQEEWNKHRTKFLQKEKEFTKARDQMTALIRNHPWVELKKDYTFGTNQGRKSLKELFSDCSQLAIWHT